MPLSLDKRQESVVFLRKTHRRAKVWQIRRADGRFLRFTDHPFVLPYLGFEYSPAGGGSGSATRKIGTLEDQGGDFGGAITDDAITFEDLYGGRYDGAEILQHTLDWRTPWIGALQTFRYWIRNVTFDGEKWTAHLSNMGIWLQTEKGRVFSRNCGHIHYDQTPGRCNANPALFALANNGAEVTTILTPHRKFRFTGQDNSQTDGYYNGGDLLWISGANAGHKSQVKVYEESPEREITLELKTPLPIVDGDKFNTWRACDRRYSTCRDVFGVSNNYGGFHLIPGTDKLLQTPRQ